MPINKSYAALLSVIAAFTGSALAADSSCKSLTGITTKNLTIPTHIYTTETASYTGGKPRLSETIYLIDKTYVQVNGKWRVSPMTPKMLLQAAKEALADPDTESHSTCRMVRDEAVDGEAATLYTSHTETEDEKSDSQIWISKSSGLPLKRESNMDVGGASGKVHRVSRYEYTNVQAPPGIH